MQNGLRTVGFAGSRRGRISREVCRALVMVLHQRGWRLLIGCCEGIDRCFRETAADLGAGSWCTVHCAFSRRVREVESIGLDAVCRVKEVPSPAAALHWRTVLMVRECSLLVLFPDDPKTGRWGKGSRLAFNTAIQDHIPVFVVTAIPPLGTRQLRVTGGSLFGVLDGHWVIPQGVEVRNEPA